MKVVYPPNLFEAGNMPQVLSSIAGNVFGMKAVKNLRLEDVRWSASLLRSFKGLGFGISGVRKIFGVRDRPLTASVPKPKVGMISEEHARVGYEAWVGGIDLLKDDENLSGQRFNQFRRRVEKSFRLMDRDEKETGEKKSYLVNVSAETREMLRRAEMVKEMGGEYVMVDILTVGWARVQSLRDACEDRACDSCPLRVSCGLHEQAGTRDIDAGGGEGWEACGGRSDPHRHGCREAGVPQGGGVEDTVRDHGQEGEG